MWYYIKDKKKIGPISDALFNLYLEKNTIQKDTLTWKSGTKDWVPAEKSPLFHNYAKEEVLTWISGLKSATRKLRASFIVLFLLIGANSYLALQKIIHITTFMDEDHLNNVEIEISHRSLNSDDLILSIISLLFLIYVLKSLYDWTLTICKNATHNDRQFKINRTFSAMSWFIPFLNLIIPCKVVGSVLFTSRKSLLQKVKARDIALVFCWWFFVILSFIMIMIYYIVLKSFDTGNLAISVLNFEICTNCIIQTTILLWILIISVIYNLQYRFFRRIEMRANSKFQK